MAYDGPLDFCPLWLLLVATIAIVCIAVEIGYRLGRYRKRHQPEKEAPVGAMVGAMLGLLAFILAFTFGMAAARYDERRHALLDESNAIGTAFLRAGLLHEPERSEARTLLRQYVDLRLQGVSEGKITEAVAASNQFHARLWSVATTVAEQDPHSIVGGLFIQSLNTVIDVHAERVMVGLRSRVPAVIWAVLYFVAMLTMATMGYQEGIAGTRRSLAALAVILTFSAVMFLILDLDRPGEGLLRINQQTLIDVQSSMNADR